MVTNSAKLEPICLLTRLNSMLTRRSKLSFFLGTCALFLLLTANSVLSEESQATLVSQDNFPASQFICAVDLKTNIDRILAKPDYQGAYWGITIKSLDSDENLYSLHENNFLTPASTTKLLTTAAALTNFSPDYRLKTPIFAQGNPPNLDTLTLVGKGDATITTEKLQNLAQKLKEQGIKSISRLIIVDSPFVVSNSQKTWEWEDVFFSYAVSASSLVLNENAVTLKILPRQLGQSLDLQWSDPIAGKQWLIDNQTTTTSQGSDNNLVIKGNLANNRLIITGYLALDSQDDFNLAIPQAAEYFLDSWRNILEKAGIMVKTAEISSQILGDEITSLESDSVSYLVEKVNKDSDNLLAETLLQMVGGVSGLQETLTKIGINSDGYKIQDGSGLSRQNLIKPNTLTKIFQLMAKNSDYRRSLAIGGIDGTLTNRFQNTPLQGRLQAKTGTLTGVIALAGYVETADNQTLIFSITVNNSDQPAPTLRNGIDEIILLLGQLKSC
jgi:serine-type D-Ala-D-Ala carboxypeptidase/endopeptidase (penicillin-binding protein 4)